MGGGGLSGAPTFLACCEALPVARVQTQDPATGVSKISRSIAPQTFEVRRPSSCTREGLPFLMGGKRDGSAVGTDAAHKRPRGRGRGRGDADAAVSAAAAPAALPSIPEQGTETPTDFPRPVGPSTLTLAACFAGVPAANRPDVAYQSPRIVDHCNVK